jgi:hypothetical protein
MLSLFPGLADHPWPGEWPACSLFRRAAETGKLLSQWSLYAPLARIPIDVKLLSPSGPEELQSTPNSHHRQPSTALARPALLWRPKWNVLTQTWRSFNRASTPSLGSTTRNILQHIVKETFQSRRRVFPLSGVVAHILLDSASVAFQSRRRVFPLSGAGWDAQTLQDRIVSIAQARLSPFRP